MVIHGQIHRHLHKRQSVSNTVIVCLFKDAVKSRKKRRSRGRKVRKKVYRRRRPKHKKVHG